MAERPLILDGHNDVLLRRWLGEELQHVDLARAARAGFAGGLFALFVPPPGALAEPPDPPYALPLADPLPREEARRAAGEQAEILEGLDVTIARRVEDFAPGRVTAVMHLEGAEPLAPDLSDLEEWYDRGLRSVGLVWSRPNAFGEGVPYRFPASPDTGPGLTEAGRALVVACNRLGILVDVSHLNAAGFDDVARLSTAPLVATHSNAHALCVSTRNLVDGQLDAIGASGGLVGVNFGTAFLREDGRTDPATPLAEIVRHVEYVLERIGADHVAFGSDFEGATIPAALGGAEGLPRLLDALRARGHDDETVERIAGGNWLRVLRETLRPWGRFYERAGDEPRATLLDAAGRFAAPGFAVDLGAGAGRDTVELLRRGWSVLAIDRQAEAIERLVALADGGSPRLEARVARAEESEWPACDLVNASFALPLLGPGAFERVWPRIVESLRPGGRFAGQLYGVHDEWAGTGVVVLTRAEVEELLAPFEVELLDEVDREGGTAIGTRKHWHVFHVVARKR